MAKLPSMYDLDAFKQTYFTECTELLDEMEALLMQLDVSVTDLDALNAIFRCAHSIKGGGGVFNFSDLVEFTHVQEALLEELRSQTLGLSQEIVDTLLQSVDGTRSLLSAAQTGASVDMTMIASLKTQLEQHAQTPLLKTTTQPTASSAPGEATYQITFAPKPSLLTTGNEPILLLRELTTLGAMQATVDMSRLPPLAELDPEVCYLQWNITLTTDAGEAAIREVFEFVEDECDLTIETSAIEKDDDAGGGVFEDAMAEIKANTAPAKPSAAPAATPAAPAAQSIRVDLDKVDGLVNMVGEMVIAQAMIMAQIRHLSVDEHMELISSVESLGQHMRDMQEAVMSVRMQPIKSVFARMARLVRDTARELGKQIELQTFGETTEIDKTVIEKLSDPLTHMIRNSMDHGIEPPDARREKGKPATGSILLSADQRGGRIIIEIKDDGNGINRERVLAKAREKGLVDARSEPTPEEIDQLVFHPGFSTAEKVTNLSGRGVGMDVVRKNIEHLGGNIVLVNHPGAGTHFTITLPLTLAILDGMVVRVGQEYYILPIASIMQSLRPTADMVHEVRHGVKVVQVREAFVPLVYLHDLFNVDGAQRDATKGIVVLAESGNHTVGLVVDEIMHQQQVVVKSIEENTHPVDGFAGATILGDGRISLILDVARIYLMSQTPKAAKHIHAMNQGNAA